MMQPIRWLKNCYEQKTLVRLTSYFLLVILPLVMISLYANSRSMDIVLEQNRKQSQSILTSETQYLDLILQNVEEISILIATDKKLLQMLNEAQSEPSSQSISQFSDLLAQMVGVTSIAQIVSDISVYHGQSELVLSTKYGGRRLHSGGLNQWAEQLSNTLGSGRKFMTPDESSSENQSLGQWFGTDSVALVRVMDPHNANRQPNLLIVTLNKERISQLLQSALPSPHTQIDLYMGNGKWAAGSEHTSLATSPVPEGEIIETRAISPNYKWLLVMRQPREEVYGDTQQVRKYTFVIIGISIVLSLCIPWGVYSRIASPLTILTHAMKKLSGGNYDFRIHNVRQDEFGFLMKSYNEMAGQLQHMIQHHYEQQLRLAHSELKFLQSQINPHFLYNTLDSIYWTAKNYDADEISEMVLNLSKFFRLSLQKGKETFTVEETLTHLHYYIRIQQVRYMDSFSVEYCIQEESKHIPIVKLLLQPLVENALLHGLDKQKEGGQLLISSLVEEDKLFLSVRDNGAGMTGQRLQYIQSELARIADRDGAALTWTESVVQDLYGLRNILSRIKMIYGRDAELQIESVEGTGTTVTVILPLDRCKDNSSLGKLLPHNEQTEEKAS